MVKPELKERIAACKSASELDLILNEQSYGNRANIYSSSDVYDTFSRFLTKLDKEFLYEIKGTQPAYKKLRSETERELDRRNKPKLWYTATLYLFALLAAVSAIKHLCID